MKGFVLGSVVLMGMIAGCSGKPAEPPVAPPLALAKRSAKLPQDTSVSMVLLHDLQSGGTREGEAVALMVAEPVKGEMEQVVIPAGAPAKGTVVWSRAEGLLGGLSNKPARLKIKLDSVQSVDGAWVKLATDQPEAEYELNRDNTGFPTAPTLPSQDAALAQFKSAYESEGLKLTPAQAEAAAKALHSISGTSQVSDTQLKQANELLERARKGEGVESLLHSGVLPMADTALTVIHTLGQAQSKLAGAIKGRNIHAFPGTKIVAKVAAETTVTVPISPNPTR